MPSIRPGEAGSGAGEQGGTDIHLGDRPVLRLFPDRGRVRVGLVIPVLDRTVDITVQPRAATTALGCSTTELEVPRSPVEVAALAALAQAAERAGAWEPGPTRPLLAAFGGVAFPLLGSVYELGGKGIPEVPRWAERVLSHSSVAGAATEAFGGKATRPVRRNLVEALRPMPDGTVDLAPLALALMGVEVLDPDRLARVLGAARVTHPADHLPDPATLHLVSRVLTRWGPERSERVLSDSAARPDGLQVLVTTARYSQELAEHGPGEPLPNRLDELHTVHRALLRGRPDPASPRGRSLLPACSDRDGVRTARRAEPAPVPRRRDPRNAIYAPPRTDRRSVSPGHRLPVPARLRELHGLHFEDLSFVLPGTAADLSTWGRQLRNCLGDFQPAVLAGHSTIIGVTYRNRLTYAVELTERREVRQFTGLANRSPSPTHREAVIRELVARGAIDVRAPRNAPWLLGIDRSA